MKGTKKPTTSQARTGQAKHWGFDVQTIDPNVRPQDDFYLYANGTWLKKTKIPPEESRWGSFHILRTYTEHQMKVIVDELQKKRNFKKGTPEQMVKDFYLSAVDMKRRNTLGSTPIDSLRKKVAGLTDQTKLVPMIAYLHRIGVSGVWCTFVDQDSKESTRYALHLWQGGLGMPERDYYLLDLPEQKRVRDAYIVHIDRVLKLAGYSPTQRGEAQQIVMKIETRLAKASMKKEDLRDPQKVYHKIKPSAFWLDYLKLLGAGVPSSVIMGQLDFFKEAIKMLSEIPLSEWKVYLDFHVVNDFSGVLSEPFIKESFNFYSKVLRGTKKMKPLWRRALTSTSSALDEPFGKLYVAKFFSEESKKKMDELVSDLFEIYEERMKRLEWMSVKTRKKAIEKLQAMNRKIAYPKKWDIYKGVSIDARDYFGNVERIHIYEHKKTMRKLSRGIDRDEWFMSPQQVNAYFAPSLNDIVFPAAILQWPFFDFSSDDALNYAGIGSVIGHEMTHAFDDQGSQFDINGNLNNWWTKEDRKLFDKRGALVVRQADLHEVMEGIFMSGKLTLGENIADLGGLVISYDAYQRFLSRNGRSDIDGLSPEKRFFLAFAQLERELRTPEMAKIQALTDPHADAKFRINGPLSNFDPFYEHFSLTKKDKLFIEKNKRARIW